MIAGGHDHLNACVFDFLQFQGKLFHILRSAVVGVVTGQYEGIGRQINDLRNQGVSDFRSKRLQRHDGIKRGRGACIVKITDNNCCEISALIDLFLILCFSFSACA